MPWIVWHPESACRVDIYLSCLQSTVGQLIYYIDPRLDTKQPSGCSATDDLSHAPNPPMLTPVFMTLVHFPLRRQGMLSSCCSLEEACYAVSSMVKGRCQDSWHSGPSLCHLVYTEHLPGLTWACSSCCSNVVRHISTRVLRPGVRRPHMNPVPGAAEGWPPPHAPQDCCILAVAALPDHAVV